MSVLVYVRQRRSLGAGLFFGLALWMAGCGSSFGTVSGKVSHKGATLRGGTVTFVGNNWSGGTTINDDGTYSLDRVPPGPMTIAVETKTARSNVPRGVPMGPPKDTPVPPGFEKSMYNKQGQADRFVPIPEQYGDADKSGLKYDVKAGKQTHDIDLP